MRTKQFVALSLIALAWVQASHAQEATPESWTPKASAVTREQVRAETAAARAAGELSVPSEHGVYERPFVSTLSRAEVLADLQLWRESGLADLSLGEATDTFSPQYRQAEQRYAQLRSSPRYAELVRQIARSRGDSLKVSAAR